MPRNLLDHIRPWFAEAFEAAASDLEDLSWALSLTTLPNPARQNQYVSAVTLYSQLPTGNGDEHLANTIMMSPGFTQETVNENVFGLVANFREKIVEAREARAAQPQPNLANLGQTNGRS